MHVLLAIAWAYGASWQVQLARMEGAATDIREGAASLAETAAGIRESGHVHSVSELFHKSDHLNQQLEFAALAAEQLSIK
jgi:hypothetical protein